MAGYWTQMFNTASEATSLTDMNQGTSASVGSGFSPLRNGKLLKVVLTIGYTSASSLIEGIRIEMTNTNFIPNTMMFYAAGDGLHTAPAFSGPNTHTRWDVDQPVTQASPITAQVINVGAASPVTLNAFVFGAFTG